MKDNKIDKFKELIKEADAIVVGGAAGMSAASGFKFYYQDDDVFRMLAGGLADKYGFKNMFDGFYDSRLTDGERWALVLRTIKYIYECETGETYIELAEFLKDKNYYAVTTNQDAQFFRVFPADKITRLQGDWRYFQCKNRCHDEIYYNHDLVMDLCDKIENDTLPDSLIPRCPHCGGEMAPWVRSREFLEGKDYMREFERYMDFLKANMHRRVLFLELGVGMMTPMFIKEPFMNMVYQWPDAFYATVNPQHAIIPKEIAAKSLGIDEDINIVLKKILGKPIDHIKADSKIFNPKRIY
uniref:SIR2 family NAD-dependent protein deacylase n=1 Tax=Candidatus Limisoma sp. TaxID=3076476 RepID=UPI004028B2F0